MSVKGQATSNNVKRIIELMKLTVVEPGMTSLRNELYQTMEQLADEVNKRLKVSGAYVYHTIRSGHTITVQADQQYLVHDLRIEDGGELRLEDGAEVVVI